MILMNDFNSEPIKLKTEIYEAVKRVIDSGWYVLGEEVESFEKVWAKKCGVAHGIGVGNGMDAIEIGLRSLDIGPDDEVVTTSMTAFATVLAILRAGAKPVLADINPDSALLSIESVIRCITPKTKAIVLVHLYGQLRDMEMWVDFCNSNNILLIEDCAQSHLAQWQGQIAGSFGKVGAYSFYPTKNLGALGDAGILVTNLDQVADKAYSIRNYGQSERYHHPVIGLNSRLDEMQAAILKTRLEWLEKFTLKRQEIAEKYFAGIDNPDINLPLKPQESSAHVYHLFVITSQSRDKLQQHLKNNKIQTHIHYPIPIHWQKSCQNIAISKEGLRNSERYAQECLSIPCHPQMTEQNIYSVIDAINSFSS